MNSATFACADLPLIAHQLQCFTRRLLFRFFLGTAAALADDIGVQANLDLEVLVMIGSSRPVDAGPRAPPRADPFRVQGLVYSRSEVNRTVLFSAKHRMVLPPAP